MAEHTTGNLATALRIFETFGPLLKKYWKWLLIGYSSLLINVAIRLLAPWPLKLVFDYVLIGKDMPDSVAWLNAWFGGDVSGLLAALCAAMVALALIGAVFAYVHRYYIAAMGHSLTNDVRNQVFDHLQNLPVSFHGSQKSGDDCI